MKTQQPIPKSNYRQRIKEEFCARENRNPRYSLRAFARDLGISLTALSDSLSGKRHLSARNIERVCQKLGLSPLVKKSFQDEVSRKQCKENRPTEKDVLEDDKFSLISEWHYFALLSLAKIPNTSAAAKHIAKRLGISEWTAEISLDRLQRLGFVDISNGVLLRKAKPVATKADVPSSAVRNYHKQILNLAENALETVPVTLRDVCATTFPVDLERLPEAKAMIAEFKNRLSARMEGAAPSEVYSLAIQLIPLTHSRR